MSCLQLYIVDCNIVAIKLKPLFGNWHASGSMDTIADKEEENKKKAL